MRIATVGLSFLICLGGISATWASVGLPPTLDSNPSLPTKTKTIRPSKPPALTREEKDLLVNGYTLEVRRSENYFCHREALVGTKFTSRVCQTAEQIKLLRQNSKDAAEHSMQKGLQSGNGH